MPCQDGLLEETFIKDLVVKTEGFSGAEVVALFAEAALLAIEENCDNLQAKYIYEAINRTDPQITLEMLDFYSTISRTLFKV